MSTTNTMSDDELRRRKHEEDLEVKSLRRIVSAYINYPEAAEEDVKRYERSFRRLPVAHKALLSHLPLKYQKLRRCISKNTYFIFEMLKAFEPPVDMSQDDDDACEHMDDGSCGHAHSEDRDPCCEPALISGRPHSKKSGEVCTGHEDNNDTHKCGCDDATCVKDENSFDPLTVSNKDPSAEAPTDYLESMPDFRVPLVDVDKVRCVIRNIVRDWATEGQKERDQCYKPILEELARHFPNRSKESPPTCLVPGAGLGRLALEISCLGFISQGNEFSYYMMICSSFILNQTQDVGEWTIHPWIHSNCNSLSDADQLRGVSIPDIHPAGAGITEGFSMCGGDFVEVYNDPSQVGAWDAVVTCFFLDTAHNIVEYIEIISKILKDGGVWINLGPLLYHFADMYGQEDEMSVELSLEDVKRVAIHYGFQLVVEKTIETTYTTNPRAMMQNHYFSAFWTMRKVGKSIPEIMDG
ncbi:uncharacterized protein LOC143535985 [Bidens hawaiensis]|uniref:uncharacterized protein LOC143535985 n=1 Tax=Bidens hawaiensis TaxID=980011 RepID=UPI0040493367